MAMKSVETESLRYRNRCLTLLKMNKVINIHKQFITAMLISGAFFLTLNVLLIVLFKKKKKVLNSGFSDLDFLNPMKPHYL